MKRLKYKVIVLDHDDTTVKSTPDIHYPQWCQTLDTFRPGEEKMSLERFMLYNCEIGFFRLIDEVMNFTKEEQRQQDIMWREYTSSHVAAFYEGMDDILRDFRALGGKIFVCTHNAAKNVLKDYEAHFGGEFYPDYVFDVDNCRGKLKPHPFALFEAGRMTGAEKNEILMVDDMKPGLIMARAAGVPFAAAGWSHIVPEIREYMKGECDIYLETTQQLRELIMEDDTKPPAI